jgi:hypothetical protein
VAEAVLLVLVVGSVFAIVMVVDSCAECGISLGEQRRLRATIEL